MKINEKIRLLREEKNWSQEEMAAKLGMSTNGYSKIERGETRIYIPKLEQIAEVLNTDLLELMAVGEKNIVLFQESGNNHSVNIIGSSQEIAFELAQLKNTLNHKEELITSLKSELETLKQMVNLLQQGAKAEQP